MCTVFPAHDIIHACWRALGLAAPERALAGWARNVFASLPATKEGADEPFVMYYNNLAAGGGAIEGRDGFNQIGHLCTLGGLPPQSRRLYEQRSTRCGSCARNSAAIPAVPGASRGGRGWITPSKSWCARASIPSRGEGLRTPPPRTARVNGGAYGGRRAQCCSRSMMPPHPSSPAIRG